LINNCDGEQNEQYNKNKRQQNISCYEQYEDDENDHHENNQSQS
jgi:hypothetical protein